ncbi:hypothetical protein ABH939_006778, partial [Rhodococcus sp. 27YEA6]
AALLPTLRVGRRERVAALPAREPLRGSQWVECRCRRSSRFAPLNSESWFSPIEFIATCELVPDTRTRLRRRGGVTKSAPSRVHCLVIIMLPIIHPHPPKPQNNPKTRNTETRTTATIFDVDENTTVHNPRNQPNTNRIPKTTDNQQHSKTPKRAPHNTPHPTPTPLKPEHPAGTQKRRRPTHPH